jgi:hypothetical protein
MQHIVASEVEVAGRSNFSAVLPRPKPRERYFRDAVLPAPLEKAKDEFYRDVAVLAFPTPEGAHRTADIDEKALYFRHPYSSQPNVKPFLPAPAQHPALPAGAAVDPARIVDLSDCLQPDGRLAWEVPEGHWTILRFGRTSTGANTRPAPEPGLGLECDKLDKAALEAHFEAFVVALLRELSPRKVSAEAGWTMLHIDSWEMGAQNWTAAFREEFRRRRGYDLLRYLPAVTGRVVENLEVSERFLWDLRETVQELIVENHAQHLKALGQRHGFGLSIEPYDMTPCADMSLGAVADVPMCEFWANCFSTFYSCFEAVSVAHTSGKRIVAAEAFTSDDKERWQFYPGSLKALGDWAFCAGVNRIVFHRYQHQPWLDLRPGMTMGPYGVHWERTQTWWHMALAYHRYLARCQFMLRQGLPVADVCFLVAEGAPHVFSPPASATRGSPPDRLGYNFDGCAPDTLITRLTVKDAKLVLPDGMSYRVLVLPERETITPMLLRKVKELVKAGATVIGPRPLKSPSLTGYPQCDGEVKQLAAELWGDCDGTSIKEHALGNGRVVWERRTREGQSITADDTSVLRNAQWIWHKEGNPATSAPVGKRYFRRVLALETNQTVQTARVFMTADNAFELWVNGSKAGSGNNFTQTCILDVAPLLRPGLNIIAVAAENGGESPNPAGLIGSLVIHFRAGHPLQVHTDRAWQSAPVASGGWTLGAAPSEGWSAALELGPFGMAPWNRSPQPGPQFEQYGDFALVTAVLGKMGVPLDFESDRPLRYIHRRDGETDLYFVANPDERLITAQCCFRVAGKQPELWDPLTGQWRDLPEFSLQKERTSVPLRFEPHQSFFVVFRRPVSQATLPGRNFPDLRQAAEVIGPWEVSFDPKWGGPAKVTFQALEDWSRRPEAGIKFYSGVATYRKAFDLPAFGAAVDEVRPRDDSAITSHRAGRQARWWLHLGTVKNLAQVRLNGCDLGVLWCAPWLVDITSVVKAKDNQLEIAVANLWPNRLIGDEQFPPDTEHQSGGNLARWPEWLLKRQPRPSPARYTFATWKYFTKDSPLLPSGLLGPVTLPIVKD